MGVEVWLTVEFLIRSKRFLVFDGRMSIYALKVGFGQQHTAPSREIHASKGDEPTSAP
jgi:hypothetical protein